MSINRPVTQTRPEPELTPQLSNLAHQIELLEQLKKQAEETEQKRQQETALLKQTWYLQPTIAIPVGNGRNLLVNRYLHHNPNSLWWHILAILEWPKNHPIYAAILAVAIIGFPSVVGIVWYGRLNVQAQGPGARTVSEQRQERRTINGNDWEFLNINYSNSQRK